MGIFDPRDLLRDWDVCQDFTRAEPLQVYPAGQRVPLALKVGSVKAFDHAEASRKARQQFSVVSA